MTILHNAVADSLVQNALAGLLVGFLVGMTGMGGASLMTPILMFVFHFRAKYAVASDLAYTAIAKFFGAIQHYRKGNVDIKLVWQLAAGSLPASLLGVWSLKQLDHHDGNQAEALITHLLGAALILVSIVLLIRSLPSVEKWFEERQAYVPRHSLGWAVLIGIAGGFLVGLTSIGAGTLFGVALILVFGLKPKQTVGTDICHGCLLSGVAAIGYVFAGYVDCTLVASLLIGAIPGVLLGGMASSKMPDRALRPALGIILMLIGLRAI